MMNCDSRGIPHRKTEWEHKKNGIRYMVYDITNDEADPGRNDEYPVTVHYRGDNRKRWSKSLANFLEKMKPVETRPRPMSWDDRIPWQPYIDNFADGVKGHYAIARWNPAGYREVWNLWNHSWSSASEDVLTYDEALVLLESITIQERSLKSRPGAAIDKLADKPKSAWNERRERINSGRLGISPTDIAIVEVPAAYSGFEFPPFKLNVTNDRNYVPAEGLWYYVDTDVLDREHARSCIRESLIAVGGALAGARSGGKLLSGIDWRRSNMAERDQIARAGMNFVGELPSYGPVLWGNRTAHGGLLPEALLLVVVLREVGLKAAAMAQSGQGFDLSAWVALEQRANEIFAEFKREHRLHPSSESRFHFSSSNCVIHITFPGSALSQDHALNSFEITGTVERNQFSFNMDEDIAYKINELVSLDWILLR